MNIRILFILLLSTFSGFLTAQKKELPLGVSINKNFKAIKFSERLNKMPFSKATKIKIVSFNLDFEEDFLEVIPIGAPEVEKKKPIDFRTKMVENNLDGFDQIKTLNLKQLDLLTEILYNTCSRYITSIHTELGCYYPRNAILFYDENDNIFEYLEICFECQKLQSKPETLIEFNEFCKMGLSDLKTFFEKNNVETERRKK